MLRVVVAAPPAVRAPEDLACLPASADLVEVRLDLLGNAWDAERIRPWIDASPRPVLATVRSRAEGGAFDGTPDAAARILEAAAGAGARWVDVETPVAPCLGALPPTVDVVASYHGEDEPPMPKEAGGRTVAQWKVARRVADADACARVRREAAAAVAGRDLTVVPYGPLGALRGAFLHPAALLYGSANAAVVEGQPSLEALLDDLRAGEVGPLARLFGLLGRPPTTSPSPSLHNAAFRCLGLDALYLPLPDLKPETALAMPFEGFSVTAPYKELALALSADADETTRRVGAANTLVRMPDGGWRASNTDLEAVLELVPRAAEGEAAYVQGAGGFARAAAFALDALGYEVRIASCEVERARALAEDGGWAYDEAEAYERGAGDRVVVNATPLGTDGVVPPFVACASLRDLVVLDAPYAPRGRETGLVRAAREAGASEIVTGLRLLACQARGQVRAFTGRDVDPLVLATALEPPPPLLLMGLRGAGKTTVGRAVAARLGRPFLDLDDEVERITGRTSAAWIREEGEDAFRVVEADAVSRLAGRRGVVVAAGGGVLEHPRARALVGAHTIPVWLDVPPPTAARRVVDDRRDRPPLASVPALDPHDEAERVWARRQAAWREVARCRVDADDEVGEVAERVVRGWLESARTSDSAGV